MTDREFKDMISVELETIALKDIYAIMQTPEGRRFFSWLLEKCGRDTQDFKGNSRDVFLAGMRNISIMLIRAIKSWGLQGVSLMQQAETEYLKLQIATGEEIKGRESNKINNKEGSKDYGVGKSKYWERL